MMKRQREQDEQDAELGLEKFAKIAAAVALQEGLTVMKMKTVPSSSQALWKQVTAKFCLADSSGILQLDSFSAPLRLSLPPSFHREAMGNLAQCQVNVYQEMHSVAIDRCDMLHAFLFDDLV